METFVQWISLHAEYAHWIIFSAIVLAGFNIPISADLLIIIAAFLAARVIPEHTVHLFLSIYLGCYLSASVAYWVGRLLGKKLNQYAWFNKIIPPKRLDKTKQFYTKYGFLTLLFGRFIPLGGRNCIFMAAGMSHTSFAKFAVWDLFASLFWSATSFYLFYSLSNHYEIVWRYVKNFNLILLIALSVTIIALFCYKRMKKPTTEAS
jgi:membrane-associated protein